MKIYEIGTGYTPIPAKVAAATESVVEELTKAFMQKTLILIQRKSLKKIQMKEKPFLKTWIRLQKSLKYSGTKTFQFCGGHSMKATENGSGGDEKETELQ